MRGEIDVEAVGRMLRTVLSSMQGYSGAPCSRSPLPASGMTSRRRALWAHRRKFGPGSMGTGRRLRPRFRSRTAGQCWCMEKLLGGDRGTSRSRGWMTISIPAGLGSRQRTSGDSRRRRRTSSNTASARRTGDLSAGVTDCPDSCRSSPAKLHGPVLSARL